MAQGLERREVERIILRYLQQHSGEERHSEIESLIRYLEFEKRLSTLSPKEVERLYDICFGDIATPQTSLNTDPEEQLSKLRRNAHDLYLRSARLFDYLNGMDYTRPPRSSER